MKRNIADKLILLIISALGIMLIIWQREVSDAIIDAVKNCVYRIIPSLFAMSVVSTAISKSGVVSGLFRHSKVDGNIVTAFIFGNIGGYPIGAKLLAEMVDDGRIDTATAAAALPFCYGCGPAFSAGIVGIAVFGDARFGIAAMCADLAANATMFIWYIATRKNRKNAVESRSGGFSTPLMIDSVNSAVSAMTGVCSMIVFFAALRAILKSILPSLFEIKIFAAVLEISNIAELSARDGITLPIAAMLLGFGGLCVIMQVAAIVGGKFSLKKFLLSRFIALPLAGGYAVIISRILDRLGIAAETATKIRLSRSSSLIPIICVAAMVAITLTYRRADS